MNSGDDGGGARNVAKAGEGHAEVYFWWDANEQGGGEEDETGECYLEVRALRWYVNLDRSFWRQLLAHKSVSGTLTIALGQNEFPISLEALHPESGTKTAAVFDEAVLPQCWYPGGDLRIAASVVCFKQDTSLSQLLKQTARTSLGLVGGMVATASSPGPGILLAKAGQTLVSGISEHLSTAQGFENLLPSDRLQRSIPPSLLRRPRMFVLFHRGKALLGAQGAEADKRWEVRDEGHGKLVPYVNGQVLDDGLWLLLEIKRSARYEGWRPWSDELRTLAAEVDGLVRDIVYGNSDPETVAKQLVADAKEDNLWARFTGLRHVIQRDLVLTRSDAARRVVEVEKRFSELRTKLDSLLSEAPPGGSAMMSQADLLIKHREVPASSAAIPEHAEELRVLGNGGAITLPGN